MCKLDKNTEIVNYLMKMYELETGKNNLAKPNCQELLDTCGGTLPYDKWCDTKTIYKPTHKSVIIFPDVSDYFKTLN